MIRLSLKRKIALTAATVVSASALIFQFVIRPTLRQVRQITAAIQQEREDLEIKYQRGQRIKKITAEFNKIKPDKDRLNAMFVPASQALELVFITTLERLAPAHDVELTFDQNRVQDLSTPESPLPLTFTLRGNFKQVLRYLVAVERLPYYFNISDLSLRGINPDRGDVLMVVNGQAFRKPYQPMAPPRQDRPPTTTPPQPNP